MSRPSFRLSRAAMSHSLISWCRRPPLSGRTTLPPRASDWRFPSPELEMGFVNLDYCRSAYRVRAFAGSSSQLSTKDSRRGSRCPGVLPQRQACYSQLPSTYFPITSLLRDFEQERFGPSLKGP